jgi:diguanylate cyclase (GGDEF)-like protein
VTTTYQPSRLSAEPFGPSPNLRLWTFAQIAAAAVVLGYVFATSTLRPEITLHWPVLPAADSRIGGLLFWLLFGLLGGLRAKARPGGAVLTFSMPFVVAGTLLGGPLAGALMGLISEFELRELRTQPWYGTLANHAVSIVAAVAAAVVSTPARAALEALLPDQLPLAFFATAMIAALVYSTVNIVLAIPTLAMRGGMTLRDASRTNDASFRSTSIAEGILAWLMAVTYVQVGPWAPLTCVALALIIWRNHDQAAALVHDSMTGLLNDLGFDPMFESAVEAARTKRRGAVLLVIDLNEFKPINDVYGHEAGDEVLKVTAQRLLTCVRATDAVARMHAAGDEFAVVFDGIETQEIATQLAGRIEMRIREPIRLRGRGESVTVTAAIGGVKIERGMTQTPNEVFTLADLRMLRAKNDASGPVFAGEEDAAALLGRKKRGPRRR